MSGNIKEPSLSIAENAENLIHLPRSFTDFQTSDKFDNTYLIIPWVTNDNSEHLCELVSGTFFRVLGTLLYFQKHCPHIPYVNVICYNNI